MSDPIRKLNIVNCREVYRGKGKNTGKEFTIFEVDALREDGAGVELPLRAFDDLPRGLGEFYVSDYTQKNGDRTYTLKAVGGRTGPSPSSSGSSDGATVVLRQRVELLEQQMGWAIDEINGLKAAVAPLVLHQASGVAAPSAANPGATAAAKTAFGGDDDVPFLWMPVEWSEVKDAAHQGDL